MRRKVELEYIFSSSVSVLFSRLSTAMGLAEWFADDVRQSGDVFIFVWNKMKYRARLLELRRNALVRFKWDDADDDEYFEFLLQVDTLTSEVALIITDFVDEEDEEDAIELWDKQIEMLHRTIGA
ncbi:MAG: SRPBCC domain-containing protein [Odoribacteraceae bacterium]|jgi:uncharacterized protein YndB with AHSA1/START domain|nr:SRPBCC domain-containing protein [Odoribacteraceae bacterium]